MNNTFSLEQISKTGELNANLILRQYKLDLMARFMEKKSNNPKLTQKEIAKELGYSSSTLQRYRNDISMNSPYRYSEFKRPQMTSNDLKRPQLNSDTQTQSKTKTKRKSKNIVAGSLNHPNQQFNEPQSDIVVNEEYLDNLINK